MAVPARAFDPYSGQWSETEPTDLRVMTWNVHDAIRSSNDKVEGFNNWTATARIVAAMKPDLLVLQEMGDNCGYGGVVDTVENLTITIDLFFHGGEDPFNGGQVTAYVQAYDPAYDLPSVFVSELTDGCNRNVIISRYPYADLNGDGLSQYSDILRILPDELVPWVPGGNGGIRGYQFAEIDLDDALYQGDLVAGNGHLKAGFEPDDLEARLRAARNVAYFVDYWYNGAGTGVPDPHGKIVDVPPATSILEPDTPVVLGGDWNEDELTNERKGPAEWITQAAVADSEGGDDGTDRDRSDMTYDDARDPFNDDEVSNRATYGSSSKLDYLAWQDSIARFRLAFIFNSMTVDPLDLLPPEVQGFPINPKLASSVASDHKPVIVDLILCCSCLGDFRMGDPAACDNIVNVTDFTVFASAYNTQVGDPDYYPCADLAPPGGDGFVNVTDFTGFASQYGQPCP